MSDLNFRWVDPIAEAEKVAELRRNVWPLIGLFLFLIFMLAMNGTPT